MQVCHICNLNTKWNKKINFKINVKKHGKDPLSIGFKKKLPKKVCSKLNDS